VPVLSRASRDQRGDDLDGKLVPLVAQLVAEVQHLWTTRRKVRTAQSEGGIVAVQIVNGHGHSFSDFVVAREGFDQSINVA